MLCNRPTCTETGAALALPGTLQERDTPAPPRAGVVTLPLPIRLRSCAGRAAGPTPAAEPQPGSHREPGARESQYPDILAMFVAGTIIDDRNGSPSPPCGRSSGSRIPEKQGVHRASPTAGDHRVSPVQRLSPAPNSGHRAPVSRHGAPACARGLARISHQLTAADTDLTVFAALNAAGGLDVLSSTLARPDSRSPCKFSHLRALARNLVRNAG